VKARGYRFRTRRIILANAVDGGSLPAFCRVTATLMPSTDSEIKIELWMPSANWNGKFVIPGKSTDEAVNFVCKNP
jgi:hypothetical protein